MRVNAPLRGELLSRRIARIKLSIALPLTQMHSFPAFVMRYQHRTELAGIGINQGFHPVSHRVERMEDVEEGRTGRQGKVVAERVDAANRHEHADRTAESKEGTWVKIELRIVYEGLAGASRAHYVADPPAKAPS